MPDPVFVTTWRFGLDACRVGWSRLINGDRAIDAIESGANVTEEDPAVNSVGYGGLPNAEGVVELDAAIMDGPTHSAGSVGGLTRIVRAISVARRVMEKTPHVMLVGQNAHRFAVREGFPERDLLTEASRRRWEDWKRQRSAAEVAHFERPGDGWHDTVGLCALDRNGDLAAGCTTSGMAWKTPGRVGDSPIIGSGLYVDNEVGAAAATGHGDEIMKACLTYRAVHYMERGYTAQQACEAAIKYMLRKRDPAVYGSYGAALIAVRKDGLYGAAATRSGFSLPRRPWQWVIATSPDAELRDGPYVAGDGGISPTP